MQIKTIESSKLEWEVFPQEDGSTTYCADGDGFVSLEQYHYEDGTPCWTLCDQGSPVADLNDIPEVQRVTLEQALEFAQNYLAATYNEIFQDFRLDK